jgi:tRNA A37 threonylcarbamoyladenosine dehydratase
VESNPADDFHFRFGGIARLYGRKALQRLRSSHVMVAGIGGVGSWAAEALARSAFGRITLIDLDDVCVSNSNRQLPALQSTLGQPKAAVMAARIREIHPGVRVEARLEFVTESSVSRLLGLEPGHAGDRPDVVLDAIDSVPNKARLIATCRRSGIPLVVCGGAGGRRDPTATRILDLASVTHDRLLASVRGRLRRDHAFPREASSFGVPCVCSAEPPVFPDAHGEPCRARIKAMAGDSLRLNCDSGFGSATFVTGTFGFAAAAHAIELILQRPPNHAEPSVVQGNR